MTTRECTDRVLTEHCVDLANLNAETTDLHLVVCTPTALCIA